MLRNYFRETAFSLRSTTQGSEPMPIILWLLGVPLSVVIVLLLVGVL